VSSIQFWNRRESCRDIEQVYGDVWVRWIYRTRFGQVLAEWVLSRAWLSRVYGWYQSSSLSRRKIDKFVRDFRIPSEDYESETEGTEFSFSSFNSFFIRRFKRGRRPFVQTPSVMPAFCEARYYAYDRVTPDLKFPVKGKALSAEALLGGPLGTEFEGGPLLLARLCPVDYHRFHFPDEGRVIRSYRLQGRLHSVNPLALQYRNEILCTNERHVTLLETRNFGKLAYVEVGALCVGKIIQSYQEVKLGTEIQNRGAELDLLRARNLGTEHEVSGTEFSRGDEKGYFLFGASTVIVLGQAGAWVPDPDLLEQTRNGIETLVRLGERLASRS
jgi:phosphatidylserine decarboxylase